MATKLLELELTQPVANIPFERGYEQYRVLIRSNNQPLGWVSFSNNINGSISKEELLDAIKKSLGPALIEQALTRSFLPQTVHNTVSEGISVIVCTRNRTAQLAGCLKTLLELDYPRYEIIIIDNAPPNDDTRQLTANLPVRYIREDLPGLDRARNKGIEAASFDIVAFTDDDVLVDRYWLQAIAKTFSNGEVMGASGYVAPAELETGPQYLFELDYGGMGHGFQQRVLKKENLDVKQLLWASNFGIGANMAFRKKVFQQIGGFDTDLDLGTPSHGGGDIEMFHRLVAAGHYFVYEPSMLVWHCHRRAIKAFRKQIFDNGRGFGCYLISCFRKKTVSRFSIIKFFFIDWLLKWNLKNLFRPHSKIPGALTLLELAGMLSSPFAYLKTKTRNKKLTRDYQS
jgi:glycosyltransferase involved in cell wall biosynthesis